MITVYISIGNSDDKLPQMDWANFQRDVGHAVRLFASRVHGDWASLPTSGWQNACMCIEIEDDEAGLLKSRLATLAGIYGQDSIAWAQVAETEFIKPT